MKKIESHYEKSVISGILNNISCKHNTTFILNESPTSFSVHTNLFSTNKYSVLKKPTLNLKQGLKWYVGKKH